MLMIYHFSINKIRLLIQAVIKINKMTYRLEYKEKTGQFHLDNYTHEENTFGWITIIKSITDDEANLFFDFIDYGFPSKIVKYKNKTVLYKANLFLKILNYDTRIKQN